MTLRPRRPIASSTPERETTRLPPAERQMTSAAVRLIATTEAAFRRADGTDRRRQPRGPEPRPMTSHRIGGQRAAAMYSLIVTGYARAA